MAFQEQSFVFGKEKIPDWFNDQLGRGRAKLNIVDDEIVSATLNKPTAKITAEVGDTIVLTKNGLSVKRKTTSAKNNKKGSEAV